MLLLQQTLLPIEILLHTIVKEYLLASYCITVVSEYPFDVKLPNNFMYIEPQENDKSCNDTLPQKMLEASEAGCSDYIVQMKDPKRFMTILDQNIHLGNTRRSERKIIILPIPDVTYKESNDELLEILTMKETSFIANILLILASEEHCITYDLVTHKYYGTTDTEQALYLDKWNSCTCKFDKNENLFPHDMANLQGKEVKVAAFTYKPYVLLDLDTGLAPLGRDGMEMRIVDEFCRWINCTVKIVRDDEHEWGEIYENLTGVGVIGNVFEDRADLGITALYSWFEEYVEMDFSCPIIRTAITCIVPSPRLLASWEMPLLPFSLYMWIGLFLTFVYASLALFVAQGFSGHKIFFTTFGIMITQSQPEHGFSSWRIRNVIGWMMLTGLVLDNAYSGGLASTFTVPKYEKSIDTIEDIVDRELTWGATHDAWIFSLMLSQEPLIKDLLRLFKTYPAEELQRKSFTRNMAFSIEKLPAGYFAIGEYITKEASKDFTIMLENFYYEQCVVMLRKSSPYTEKLSEFVGRLHESGLILSWETQVALNYLDFEVQLEVKLSRSKHDVENIEPLSFRQVVGVFIIYGLGMGAAVIAFVFEVLIFREKKI
ncbi:glutamate receptor ionotropic, kainate 2-like [Aricia agestis]|uniref:glutamate receptor ionotropic, kainate 2-like n=1 Tax=Aricia agestis TaxID=91739 RepID=UPI001C20924B|nr:glutamate receptor ionotropic, kainate 2-like [Aricia agestis]